jgi:hypothetical protein
VTLAPDAPIWITTPSTVAISYIARTDGIPGNWTKVAVGAQGSGVMRLYATSNQISTDYAGQALVAFCEMGLTGADANYTAGSQGVQMKIIGWGLSSSASAYSALLFHGTDASVLPPYAVLQTPLYLNPVLAGISGSPTGTITSIALASNLDVNLASGESILIQKASGSGTQESGKFATVNGNHSAGVSTININSVTLDNSGGYSAGFVVRTTPTPTPAVDFNGSVTTGYIELTLTGGGTYYFGRVGIVPVQT